MAASPFSSSDGDDPTAGTVPPRPTSLTQWLRGRSDRQLGQLLRLRPDLALPAPADLAALAARIGVRTSTQRAVDGLDAYELRVLETLVLAAGDDDTIESADHDGVAALLDLALVWGDPDLLHLAPTVRECVGPYPAGLGRPAALLYALVPDIQLVAVLRNLGLEPAAQPGAGASVAAILADPRRVATMVAAAEPAEHEVLERLAAGPPVGTVRNTRLATTDAELGPPHRLINRGLLVPIDTQRVELPREVGLVLREDVADTTSATPPQIQLVTREPAELDRLGTTAVREALRLVDALADSWTAHPPPMLRSGGVGVRDLRRTARDLGVDEPTTALVAEIAYAASLVNSTNGPEPAFLPTTEYDVWHGRDTAQRWIVLASAWLAMTRQPSLVSQRGDRDRVITALGPDAERGTIPNLRRQVLGTLTALPPGSSPTERGDVLALLSWHQPRRATGQRPLAEAILSEADLLGITAAGGLTGYTRTLLAGSAGAAEHALAHALPDPVDHFLVQPDLTVVVPGPPNSTISTELGLVADLESTGGASVYRITERSVRRALDAGRTGVQLARFVTDHSRTPVPQALQYLIDDAARRHGVLRAGTAGSYLRCDDVALLSRVMAEKVAVTLNLRLIAPTVVVSDAPIGRVLDGLREAGYAPAAEAPGGGLMTLTFDAPRSPTRPPMRTISTRTSTDSDAQLNELVRRIRSGDELIKLGSRVHPIASQVPGVTSAATMELLRRAVREDREVWLGVAEPDGTATAHNIHPISLAAGSVRGYERGRVGLASYPVHRITAIRLLDDVDEDDEQ